MKKGLLWHGILLGLLLAPVSRVRGDANVVWDFDDGFSPRTVVIGPDEAVTWWNYDPYGFDVTVTFDNNFSFDLPDNQGQGVVFPSQPGTYGYHSNWGDNGAVIVNVPPVVAITNPPANALFPAPATFTIQADATDTADDYVSDVQFFLGTSEGTNLLEDVYSPPFTTSVSDLAAGTYSLLAVATDSRGAPATNAITITVGGGATVNLEAPRFSDGQFLFDAAGLTAGKTNVLQTSTNLVAWQPVSTNIAGSSSVTITNLPSSGILFYRLLQLP